jgi:hypothetical protein
MDKKILNNIINQLDTDKTELNVHRVELNLLNRILSDVSANEKSMMKVRTKTRKAFDLLLSAAQSVEDVKSRNKKIEKGSKDYKDNVKILGIKPNDLPAEGRIAYNNNYIDNTADREFKAIGGALSSLRTGNNV